MILAAILAFILGLPGVAPAAVARRGDTVMGTVLDVVVIAGDAENARLLADGAIAEAHHWDNVLTIWRSDGELARFNARAGREPGPVSSDLLSALRHMQRLATETHEAFDPAVGPLVDLWRTASSPPRSARAALVPRTIADALIIRNDRARLRPGTRLDPGGIGKGIALDAAAHRLRNGGATAAFLDFGGSSQLALGAPPGAPEGWSVAVSGLRNGEILGIVQLRDAAVSTSRAVPAGAPSGPIIDPRSGAPVTTPCLATVVASSATTADAWSTALVVLGREGTERVRAVEALYQDGAGTTRTSGFRLQPGNPLHSAGKQ